MRSPIDPRVQILYVLSLGVLVFATSRAEVLVPMLALQGILWFAVGLPARLLLRSLSRLLLLVTLIVLSFAFFGSSEGDRIVSVGLGSWTLHVNLSGVAEGLLRSSRFVTVVLASQLVQRSGDGTALVRGLRGLGVPEFLAAAMDLVLAALGPTRPGRGDGSGRGRRGKARGEGASGGFEFRRLLRGDVSALTDLVEQSIRRGREGSRAHALEPERRTDLAVIVGLAVVAMTLRFLVVLPGLPIAPGHKGILLIPLYVLANGLTRTRWGATQLGLLVGVTGFLMGMGRYGPFDVLQHLAPGLFVDLAMPAVQRLASAPRAWVFCGIGVGAALTRVTTLAAIAAFAGAPPAFYALLLPAVAAHVVFGFLSGFVTFALMRRLGRLSEAAQADGGTTEFPAAGGASPEESAALERGPGTGRGGGRGRGPSRGR